MSTDPFQPPGGTPATPGVLDPVSEKKPPAAPSVESPGPGLLHPETGRCCRVA